MESSVLCHPVVVAQRNKKWIINIAIILKPTMPSATGHRRAHQANRQIIMPPIITVSVQTVIWVSNKWPAQKCASFALKFYTVNCIAWTISRRPISPTKHCRSQQPHLKSHSKDKRDFIAWFQSVVRYLAHWSWSPVARMHWNIQFDEFTFRYAFLHLELEILFKLQPMTNVYIVMKVSKNTLLQAR